MKSEEAIEILSRRGDQIAEALNVEEGQGWRDNTGTAHLYIRGALQSLERIKNGAHDAVQAGLAMGTVGFANKSPDGFFGEHSGEAAAIAMHILQTEMTGGSFQDAINTEDLDLLVQDLDGFTVNIKEQASHEGTADASLIAFAGALHLANTHYQTLSIQWKNDLGFKPGLNAPSFDGPA
ncbi:MAG: hypothetical protein AAF182_02670 [Pseudomonadota bacterium]